MRAFLLVALLKLSSHYDSCRERIPSIIRKYKGCSLLELQQRAVEFDAVLVKHWNIRDMLAERIPVLNEVVYQSKRADPVVAALGPTVRVASPPLFTENPDVSSTASTKLANNADLVNLLHLNLEKGAPESNVKGVSVLQDLLDLDTPTTLKFSHTKDVSTKSENLLNIVSIPQDAMMSRPLLPATKRTSFNSMDTELSSCPLKVVDHSLGKLSELPCLSPLGNEQFGEMYSAQGPLFPSIIVLQTSRLKVLFDFTKPAHNPQVTIIHATYFNSSTDLLTDLMLQAAVPKFLQLKLDPASGNVLLPNVNKFITQCLTVTNSLHGQKRLMMRIRVTYKVNGQDIIEQAQIENFPPAL